MCNTKTKNTVKIRKIKASTTYAMENKRNPFNDGLEIYSVTQIRDKNELLPPNFHSTSTTWCIPVQFITEV